MQLVPSKSTAMGDLDANSLSHTMFAEACVTRILTACSSFEPCPSISSTNPLESTTRVIRVTGGLGWVAADVLIRRLKN